MNPDELEEIIGMTLTSGMDRDILSGWGGLVYIL